MQCNILELRWKEHIIEKIWLKHQVEPEEVEEVIYEDEDLEAVSYGSNRYLIRGQTLAGRYLLIVLEKESQGDIVPITARDLTDREKSNLKRRRR